ncbi:MAG: prepilin peptidase [Planctomycetota bacterium]
MLIEAQAGLPIWALKHLPSGIFAVLFGACVGSFLNVVVYRLPAGISVISPPSRCPTCGAKLTFFRDNLPVLGWLMLRGKCRTCGVRISPQYMIIELLVALMAGGLYMLLYVWRPGSAWWTEIGNMWWYQSHFYFSWPAFILLVLLLAGLLAMTLIDAKQFIIPIEIPLFVTIAAFVLYPIQFMVQSVRPAGPMLRVDWPIPGTGPAIAGAALLGMLGVVVAVVLLRMKVFRYSFEDYYDYVDPKDTIGDYPHARREMFKELAFLSPVLAGLALGYVIGPFVFGQTVPPLVQVVAASALGYLVGCGLIWGIRIIGTLGFGREAMGLGDVHLLGAVGAVLGWYEPILVFFVAPFSGILWHIGSMFLGAVMGDKARRELPYGPHLAIATLLVILGRPFLDTVMTTVLGAIPLPTPGFI